MEAKHILLDPESFNRMLRKVLKTMLSYDTHNVYEQPTSYLEILQHVFIALSSNAKQVEHI